ncbi:aminotransferase class V-fold PLP-dependent enzyme [Olivibacter sp. SDN3]|uniref:aminotransferase class V-fold PLP-dependent enzyme n=1 Tax=Olivibacter sp. SDN3 TaxID=2764720 RepID=UPI00165156BF|nr:aminotransferase class V-fold PLP-dependent enzyme [Olivibacter sp. SDN3]QNL50760.1 aminotransferase class V-fold PLP-dependent enzyme [Olivibacter sp. SDN3]
MKRRSLLKLLSVLPIGSAVGQPLWRDAIEQHRVGSPKNLFQELGVRTFINAAGTYTAMTGSLMRPEVLETINSSSTTFCMLDELQDKVGERIANLVKAESAVVTSGCFSAMTLGLAGILTGMDEKKVEQLPHLDGTDMKSEVICQKGHNIVYSHALRNTGCKIVQIETAEELRKAINPKTAMLFFLHIQSDQGLIMHEEWVSIAREFDIPTMIDIAADVPPVSNLWKFHEMGFDLVCVSGGKAIRGPQSAGLLMGKKKFIDAARLSMPPRGFNIGRGMKVNKEEILGMYMALEKFIQADHDAEWQQQEESVKKIAVAVQSLPTVSTEIVVPPLGNITPTLHIKWNPDQLGVKGVEVQEKLRAGNPSIEIGSATDDEITITSWMLQPGQDLVVAAHLKAAMS